MTSSTVRPKEQLGQQLIAQGAVSIEDIESALSEQQSDGHQRLLGEILVAMGSCTEAQVARALAESYGIPYAQITPDLCDPVAFAILPRKFIEENLILPMFCVKNTLTVALCEPANLFLLDQVKQITGYDIQYVCATAKDIRATIQAYCPREKTYITHDVYYEGLDSTEGLSHDFRQITDIAPESQPMIQWIERLMCEAVNCQASEIYFEPDKTCVRVRFRAEGKLTEEKRFNSAMLKAVLAYFRTIANLDEPVIPEPQESLIQLLIKGQSVEFRLFILPSLWGEMITLQASDPKRLLYGLESLGFTLETLTQLQRIIQKPKGLVLVAGPPKSGKKTTLYAMLRDDCHHKLQICTVEDSVLCRVPGINQFAVAQGTQNDQIGVLRYAIQQHPDVIMVNEIHNAETALLCLKAANDGVRVFAGIQAPDAISAITRLLIMGVPAYAVSDCLNAVLALRRIPKICAHCKVADVFSSGIRSYLKDIDVSTDVSAFRGAGCQYCRHTGYTGNIGIHELIEIDREMRQAILRGPESETFKSWAESKVYRSLLADGLDKAKAGYVTVEDAVYATSFV